jgi:hypothetical protein
MRSAGESCIRLTTPTEASTLMMGTIKHAPMK